ncbi:protoporphyrinogen oxidase [Rubritalea marina]|uniref:protoporphyrinogen oxidase n=1 Tax=Rubritalea marina TaxID=361055 RepID=UPI0003605752|nr:protoporphyrinogen oxidase [Rubritalea marina]
MRKHIAIIGAGVSGLSTAYHLQQAGHSVVVFESSKRAGGVIQTIREDDYLCEWGPNSLMIGDKRIEALLKSIGLDDEILEANTASKKRFIIDRDRLQALPNGPFQLLGSPIFSLKAKLRLLKEPWVKRHPANSKETLADFMERRLGPEPVAKLVNPFISGIYAGDPKRLAVEHAFPKLFQLEQDYGSLIWGMIRSKKDQKNSFKSKHKLQKRRIVSFKQGMEALPQAMAAALDEGTLIFEAKIGGISQNRNNKRWHMDWKCPNGTIGQGSFDAVILTQASHHLNDIPLDEEVLESLSKLPSIDHAPVTSMLLGFKREQIKHPLDGFGMLSTFEQKSKMLGALFTSSLFPGRAPEGHVAINVMIGGVRRPELCELPEPTLRANILDELRRLLGVDGKPSFCHIHHTSKAIPQLHTDYGIVAQQIIDCEREHPGLYLAGSYRNGIALPDRLLEGISLTEKINQSL